MLNKLFKYLIHLIYIKYPLQHIKRIELHAKFTSKNLLGCAFLVLLVHNLVIYATPHLEQETINNDWLIFIII